MIQRIVDYMETYKGNPAKADRDIILACVVLVLLIWWA